MTWFQSKSDMIRKTILIDEGFVVCKWEGWAPGDIPINLKQNSTNYNSGSEYGYPAHCSTNVVTADDQSSDWKLKELCVKWLVTVSSFL